MFRPISALIDLLGSCLHRSATVATSERYLRLANPPNSSEAPLVRPASIEDLDAARSWSALRGGLTSPASSPATRDRSRASRSRPPINGTPRPTPVGAPGVTTSAERFSAASSACIVFLIGSLSVLEIHSSLRHEARSSRVDLTLGVVSTRVACGRCEVWPTSLWTKRRRASW